MMGQDADPWDWSIDAVVDEFCSVRSTWANSGRSALPDPIKFERILRENDVDGIILLSEIGQNELKSDFNIKSVGQRSNIAWAIQQLRQRSGKYKVHVESTLTNPTILSTGSQTPYSSAWPTYSPLHSTIRDTPIPTGRFSEESIAPSNNVALASNSTSLKAGNLITEREYEASHTAPVGESHMAGGIVPLVPNVQVSASIQSVEPVVGQRRQAETLIKQGGQKKRRLTLGEPTVPINFSAAKLKTSDSNHLILPSRSILSGMTSALPSFLGPRKLTTEEIFFGNGKFGKEVNSEWDVRPVPQDFSAESFELMVHSDRSIPGRQSAVYRRLLHFFDKGAFPRVVDINGSAAYVVTPYSAPEIAGSSRSVILFQPTDTGVNITRERASKFDAGGSIEQELDSTSSSNHAWDYLDHWRHEKSEELPVYGESEADSEWDRCAESMEAEEEAEAAKELRFNSRILQTNIVDEVVNEEVDRFIKLWQTQKLPLRQNRAWFTWRKAKNSKQRIDMATDSRKTALKLTTRLERLKASVVDEEWYSEMKVRDLCKSMEETVYQREEERFKTSVWLHAEPPPRPVTELRTRKKASILHDSDQDGIALSSDSEVFDEREDDFIDIDMEAVEQVDMTNELSSPKESEYHSAIDSDPGAPGRRSNIPQSNLEIKGDCDNEEHVSPTSPIAVKCEKALAKAIQPGGSAQHVIDLTASDEEKEGPVDAPDQNRPNVWTTTARQEQSEEFGPNPFEDADAKIFAWDYQVLEENSDRRRLIIKLVRTMPRDDYTKLRRFALRESRHDLPGQIFAAADKILHASTLDDHEDARINQILRLYCCWLEGSADCFRHTIQSDLWGFLQPSIPPALLENVMAKVRTDKDDSRRFVDFLRQLLETYDNPILGHLSPTARRRVEDIDVLSADEDSELEPSQNTPHKKRKRLVHESQIAKQKRDRAQLHRDAYEDRARMVLQTQSSGLEEVASTEYMVNIGKQNDQEPIYLNPYIGERIQSHQLEGIQFMWREIVAASAEGEDQTGCLLAHTMGLGKTMQAIALLVTIAEAASSTKKTIRSQIPKSLRKSKTLIILPAALAYNWMDEFEKWVPPGRSGALGLIQTMRSEDKTSTRLRTLESWYHSGGILIMSYDLVRLWVANNPTKISAARFSPTEHENVLKWLLSGPNLVIADEAHFLKNIDSKIHTAVAGFKTKSRIALTGSPLNNNLKEYYAMINWISPDYLGPQREFNARYVEPIQEGLYASSTAQERRTSRKRLKTLESILEPKIHRKEVTVLKGRIKPKVEFSIKLPLTAIQEQAYRAFIESIHSVGAEIMSNARLWSWMDNLTLLCNHPTLFWEKMKELKEKKLAVSQARSPCNVDERARSPQKKIPDTSTEDTSLDLAESGAATPTVDEEVPTGVVQGVMEKLAQIMEAIKENPYSSEHSYKVKLLLRLLRHSEVVGDRVLVFSHSIATLNFLQRVLARKKINYNRLDGQTHMGDRQAMMKKFNQGAWCVFLISTRAGGLGFNLPGANRVVLFDFHFNPTWEEQAIGRAYRLGQEKPVFVYRFFTGGTFEEELLNVAIFKIQLAYTVVEKKNIKSRAEKFAKWLVFPEPVYQEDLHDHKNKDDVLDMIIARLESGEEGGLYIRAIRTTETLQEEWDEILDDADHLEIQNEIAKEKFRLENPGYKFHDALAASANSLRLQLPQGAPAPNFSPASLVADMSGQSNGSSNRPQARQVQEGAQLQPYMKSGITSEFGKPQTESIRTTGLPATSVTRTPISFTRYTDGIPTSKSLTRMHSRFPDLQRTGSGHLRLGEASETITPSASDPSRLPAGIANHPATQINPHFPNRPNSNSNSSKEVGESSDVAPEARR